MRLTHVCAAVVLLCVLTSVASAQYLMMPDSASANFRMTLFDPFNGSLVNSNYFPLNGATNSTPLHAMQVGNEIWLSEQVGDRIARYDLTGNFLSQIGGGATGGMDNVRGMEQVGNTVYLTNGGAGNGAPSASAVLMFDTTGASQGNFSTLGLAPSPFGALEHNGQLLVSSSSANDDIHRFSFAGAPLGTFHNSTSINFAEQMDHAHDGSVWVAVFTTNIVARLDPNTGAILNSFPASGARGVAQLGNGNVLWSNSAGAHVWDVTLQQDSLIYATSGGRYFDRLNIPEPASALTLAAVGAMIVLRRRAA